MSRSENLEIAWKIVDSIRLKSLAMSPENITADRDEARSIIVASLDEAEARGRYEGETYIEELKLKSPSKTPGHWPTKKVSAVELRKMYPEDSDGRKIQWPSEDEIKDAAKHEDSDGYFGFLTGARWMRERVEGNK